MIVPEGECRLEGFDERIVSLYARGMSVREIRGHLEELYVVSVSPDLISRVTDAVLEVVREWRNRPLDPVCPVVFFDALRVNIRDEGLVRNKAVYLALAITSEGDKEVLGLWIEQTEGTIEVAGAARLDEFEARRGERYTAVAPVWRCVWEHVAPMFAFSSAIRKMIYTTNALESLHRSLRKIIKARGSFPSDEAATKLLFLAIRNAGIRRRRPVDWTAAKGQFAIVFEDRFPGSAG